MCSHPSLRWALRMCRGSRIGTAISVHGSANPQWWWLWTCCALHSRSRHMGSRLLLSRQARQGTPHLTLLLMALSPWISLGQPAARFIILSLCCTALTEPFILFLQIPFMLTLHTAISGTQFNAYESRLLHGCMTSFNFILFCTNMLMKDRVKHQGNITMYFTGRNI